MACSKLSANSVFTKTEMKKLRRRCDDYLNDLAELKKVNYLYRNKNKEYFDDIMKNRGGIMKRYLKDQGGDPRCPINGILKGLFFSATLGFNDEDDPDALPPVSPFGPWRLRIPVARLIDTTKNLYFADFYCMTDSGNHCIILVVTEPGSKEDHYCSQHLLELDLDANEYLQLNEDSDEEDEKAEVLVCHREQLYVEVFYTQDINIREEKEYGASFNTVEVIGSGSSKPNGIPKRPHCHICNI